MSGRKSAPRMLASGVMSFGCVLACIASLSIYGLAQQPGFLADTSVLANAHIKPLHPAPRDVRTGQANERFGIFGIDSIPNFNGQYFVAGFDPNGNPNQHWYTNTVGNPPVIGGTTYIGAAIQPVNIELDDVNGNLGFFFGNPLVSLATPFVAPVLNSPIFSNANYSSSDVPTQFNDAVQRAQYYNNMKPNWHTLLVPRVMPPLTLHIRQSAECPTGPNFAGCNFVYSPNPDGTCCSFILVNVSAVSIAFQNAISFEALAGSISTKEITSYIVPNTFVFGADITECCVLGLHEYFFDSTTVPEKRWIFNISNWVSPGSPIGQFFVAEDISPLSHEMAEIFNDPFIASDSVHDVTPWWLAPNGNCQTNLETGDVIERLPNAGFPIELNGFTYHPQTEALLQWFQFKSPSNALNGAYSYPDIGVLTQAPAPQRPFCAP